MIVAGAIAPHGTPAFSPGPTRDGLEEIGRRLLAAEADAIVVVTPHNVHIEGHFAVVTAGTVAGSLADWGEPDRELSREVDHGLAAAIRDRARRDGLPVVAVSYGGNDEQTAVAPLDWGALIPLAFLPELRVVLVSPARDRPLEEHVALGRSLAAASGSRRVVLVASADHGHAHDPDGPYGFDPAAARYDEQIVELVRSNQLVRLPELEAIVDAAKADSLWQLLVLHGAVGDEYAAELLSYEAPTYFGMLCAAYAPA
jgi:aromatic ring-opening dioxygenase LigB subunit